MDVTHSGFQATEKLVRRPYGLVISDLRMPDMDGVELLLAIVRSDLATKPRFMMVTGEKDPATLLRLRSTGADAVLQKPLTAAHLRDAIEAVFCSPPAVAA